MGASLHPEMKGYVHGMGAHRISNQDKIHEAKVYSEGAAEGMLHVGEATVNAGHNCDTLRRLKEAIQQK
jgi:hypothetical protein